MIHLGKMCESEGGKTWTIASTLVNARMAVAFTKADGSDNIVNIYGTIRCNRHSSSR